MTQHKRIGVVGAGAIGMLYAALLARAVPGQVSLLTRRSAAKAQLVDGITVAGANGGSHTGPVKILTYEEASAGDQDKFDLLLVAVATYDNVTLAPWLASWLSPDGLCITLQNGLDNRATLASVIGAERTIQASTTFAAHQRADHLVQINGPGSTALPALPAAFSWASALFERAGLNPVHVADADQLAWTKMSTGALGVLCIVLAAPAGKIHALPGVLPVAEQALRETVAVAAACGVALDVEDLLARQKKAWRSLDDQTRASLYTSFVAGRKTELDDRFGAVLRRAQQHGVATPVLTCLYQLAQARIALGPTPSRGA